MSAPAAPQAGAGDARSAAALLRSTDTIRTRAAALLDRARRGESAVFTVDDGALDTVAAVVAEVTRARYPTLQIPYHSRWRHFEAGGTDRRASLVRALVAAGQTDAPAQARAHIDLALVSVLLDAGAGPRWTYREASSGHDFNRSEGLGVASFHAFMAGLFSSDPARPLQADAAGLQAVTAEALARAFQAGPANPLVGLEGRAALLRSLGDALAAQPEVFGRPGRPGGLLDHLTGQATPLSSVRPADLAPQGEAPASDAGALQADAILRALLDTLSGIWPAQNTLGGPSAEAVPLGDCWPHPAVRGPGLSDGWMPFHKLSQWLSYSLLEPFAWAGVPVTGLDRLTGLPEYRNGGLLLDGGVLRWRDPALPARPQAAGDAAIVEWRALTVALLDELAPRVRGQLGVTAEQMPLACVLEGGTWAAGRVLAQRLRDGSPPLNITSDGTVF